MYKTKGVVVKGEALGRTIGFPTLNLEGYSFVENIPEYGVYACKVDIEGVVYSGILHFGPKGPSSAEGKVFLEVNVFDFDRDVYGVEVEVTFGKFVRGVLQFESFADLKVQIEKDRFTLAH